MPMTSVPPSFERYRPLIDDWDAFAAALSRPLPTCIWTNTLRAAPEQVAAILSADGIPFEALPWMPGGFQLPADSDFRPGRHWAYLAGLYHVQEAVSMLPVALLTPQPGERILDLCAAPGNKTAQIAVALDNTGTVVANDKKIGRMRAARHTIERLGLANVTTTVYNGANYPAGAGLFDRVLVDAPCSGEGTSRKNPAVLHRADFLAFSGKNWKTQRGLLRKAIQRCKPGGRIVYATCTFAPEENELIVDAVLREYEATVQLVPARIDGFTTVPGLTGWEGQTLHPSLVKALRVWPHHNDSGGFFIAVLQKAGDLEPIASQAEAESLPIESGPLSTLADRFGVPPEILSRYTFFQPNDKAIYATSKVHLPPQQPKPDAVGVLFMKINNRYPKLTTAGAMMVGAHAERNAVELDSAQLEAYVTRQDVQLSVGQCAPVEGYGYVLVRHQGATLGVGLFQPDETGGVVKSMYPKGWMPSGIENRG